MLADQASWRNPRVLATLLLIFLGGAAAGALTMRVGARPAASKSSGPYWKESGREIALQRFKKELNLTDVQTQQMETILDDFVMYVQTLQAQMDEVRASGKERILRCLKPEQRLKFEKMISELQSRQLR